MIRIFMKVKFVHNFEDIISLDNLLEAWEDFVCGKRGKRDVQIFSMDLMDNVFSLHTDLANHTYNHGPYQAFNICDPKPRNIHKATVRDRLLHHAIYRKLYPFFDRAFISDSFSCRLNKGTHKAINRFRSFNYEVSKNNTRTCWILKCDIRKFFANIDHDILKSILAEYTPDQNTLWLIAKVIDSFNSSIFGVGLPLGNLTSQLFVNIYMNEFDQFVKHRLKIKYYIRYADDFVIFSESKLYLESLIPKIRGFLLDKLKLTLRPDKLFIKTLANGVDFLGWVHFSDHRVLRKATRRRMMRRITIEPKPETVVSYLGMLKHGNTNKIQKYFPNGSFPPPNSIRLWRSYGASI